MPDERIREYIVEGLIGQGGMGSVYLASHIHLGTKAALKVLLEQYSDDPSIKERFINEARLLHDLQHPNIVLQKEFFEEKGRLVLVMEYVDGRGLDRMIGQEVGPIPWKKALPLFMQVLDGIGYAHSKSIIHRDIKPSNILISREGRVKITDLGIAKIAGQKGLTRTGAQMGTLYYESPEQVKGARDVDHRSDIYSLGMTLYEMLAGRLPFDRNGDSSEFEIMNTIVHRAEHLNPREYYPHIPEWLVKVVQKATYLDPEKRFNNCEHFKQIIEKYGKLSETESDYWAGKAASMTPAPLSSKPISSGTPVPASTEDRCPGCGATVKEEMEFCGKCGVDLQKTCPGCSKKIRWHHEFCPKCGVSIAEKREEIEAKKERLKLEKARKREAAELAEQKRKEEEARKREAARAAEQKRLEEVERLEEERIRLEEVKRLRRRRWWKRHWLKAAFGIACITVVLTILTRPRFNESGGTITDRSTNLQWRVGPDSSTDWYEADSWVMGLGGDWRLPTRAELQELYNAGIRYRDWGPFENSGSFVWSGEVRDSSSAWGVNFGSGYEAWLTRDHDYSKRAFAVRPRG